ncbi:hypothetical protein Q6301_20420 [Klebsiella quasipneumoniae]|uniref:hypothetical protein n=1 Tax=Klebsiella quasipneumoniae TaxID=1463165 RepID=UPI00272F938E|nr:hypothetical protein [Klebsiella quasipneumoniae]MDP1297943.1 hypothetical protein [Klebsiella quasipneumoniae]
MTLLEILVRELPKHGGWPDGAVFVAQEEGGELWSFTSKPQKDCDDEWLDESHGGYHTKVGKLCEASDHDISTITREQYEAALAEAGPEWNGEGLPPVGCECEYLDSNNEWYPVTIKYASNQIVVICGMTNIFGEEQETEIAKDVQLDKPQFRPIRSEADMKRAELAKALHIAAGAAPIDLGGIGPLYLELADKIIAGEIPHLKIV